MSLSLPDVDFANRDNRDYASRARQGTNMKLHHLGTLSRERKYESTRAEILKINKRIQLSLVLLMDFSMVIVSTPNQEWKTESVSQF